MKSLLDDIRAGETITFTCGGLPPDKPVLVVRDGCAGMTTNAARGEILTFMFREPSEIERSNGLIGLSVQQAAPLPPPGGAAQNAPPGLFAPIASNAHASAERK